MHLLTLFSSVNAIYTFYRRRHYRLFESPVDVPPSTPSAHRVKVQSSPMSSSPLRFLSRMIEDSSVEARAHADATRDVWEVAVWDPLPLCLRLFCLFSPGHVLVYWLFLPTLPSDPRPSTTVLTAIVVGIVLSVQLVVLQANYSQQSKDTAVIHKEVLHEYDVKFVHPRTNTPVRDVGTQHDVHDAADENSVDTYTATAIVNKGFRTMPNPNYAQHTDPHGSGTYGPGPLLRSSSTPSQARDLASPLRRSVIKQPQFRASTGGDGGSLGVFSHAHSPLRKAASTTFQPHAAREGSRGLSLGMQGNGPARPRSPTKRDGSPLKRSSVPGGSLGPQHDLRLGPSSGGALDRREPGYF